MKQLCFKVWSSPRSGVEAFPGLQRAPNSFVEAASSIGDDFLHWPLAVFSHGIPGTRKPKPQQPLGPQENRSSLPSVPVCSQLLSAPDRQERTRS
eukprot:bmy_09850T0